jgi:hypothetical protein
MSEYEREAVRWLCLLGATGVGVALMVVAAAGGP